MRASRRRTRIKTKPDLPHVFPSTLAEYQRSASPAVLMIQPRRISHVSLFRDPLFFSNIERKQAKANNNSKQKVLLTSLLR